MQFKKLLNDDDAVSPVIGVILMVAITVILAAVIGTFVLGLGDQVQSTAPNAQMSFDYTEDASVGDSDVDWTDSGGTVSGTGYLTITQDGGQSVPASQLSLSGAGDAYGTNPTNWEWGGSNSDTSYAADDSIAAGDSVTVGIASGDDTVSVIWTSEGGDQSSTVAEWENNN